MNQYVCVLAIVLFIFLFFILPVLLERGRKSGRRASYGERQRRRRRGKPLDKAKLQRFNLPIIASEQQLAEWLGLPRSRLRWFTQDKPADTIYHYVRYTIPQWGGGQRVILAPKRELKLLQRQVLYGLLANAPASESAHGFVRKRSIVTNALLHVGKKVVLKIDLQDFFPSITFPRVRGLFVSLGYPSGVARALTRLCTECDRQVEKRDGKTVFVGNGPRYLVQGAPTSPTISNLIAWRLDRRLDGLAKKHGFTYTRYADDLTFSGGDPDVALRILDVAQRVVADEGFKVNPAKTRLYGRSARQVVTGAVVNDQLGTPRRLRRRLRAILHNARRTGLEAQNQEGRKDFRAHLAGLIGYVHMVNPGQARRLEESLRSL